MPRAIPPKHSSNPSPFGSWNTGISIDCSACPCCEAKEPRRIDDHVRLAFTSRSAALLTGPTTSTRNAILLVWSSGKVSHNKVGTTLFDVALPLVPEERIESKGRPSTWNQEPSTKDSAGGSDSASSTLSASMSLWLVCPSVTMIATRWPTLKDVALNFCEIFITGSLSTTSGAAALMTSCGC
ncbi:hypothetical protein HMI54_010929 [Coelomomyces lativittatus]|nr:hypothetical protein HMI54_010929 [Coelomomyces lativittatus]